MTMAEVPQETFDTYLSCFSAHTVAFKGIVYQTAEHAYHCQRYSDPAILLEIRFAPTAKDAWAASQKHKSEQFPDFGEQKRAVMKEILEAKLAQHPDVREALRGTGMMDIVKAEPRDAYWGTGPDGKGRNELGKLWMELRRGLSVV